MPLTALMRNLSKAPVLISRAAVICTAVAFQNCPHRHQPVRPNRREVHLMIISAFALTCM